ncbi:SDR family NAD(P)-dependent oxidoreductase [Corynebacterium guangdongense]|uniref:3-oxoacyl-[acyl-carrier protein] reductase n=1 Tax=Corynebacterium guangdongense TaxID=1783348 RepID=A0ABU1ZTW9_9CORY|nr:SDR family NAD(P)-dependent oxidoreductase [Corynebacterium guangdongense]MDR7328374.1 3-oxoacyl-[acyl-carrier protein] reductase [Corynebacterium guangdongense]WJZ16951.1 3-oxoacyl-[acyl-carrier-protein] reductase FabG [Corynebacterium guangdongense]
MTQPTQKLAGKVAVVTGAASGMGRATVRTFVEQGAKVYALDISQDTLAREYEGNDNVVARACDISDSAAVNAVFEEITEQEGKLDTLVNAAGISTPGRRATEWMDDINHRMIAAMKAGEPFNPEFMTAIPDEDFDRVLKINLYGSFYTIRAAVPLLKAAGGGSITNFASIAGLVSLPMPAYYPASKAAVIGMTKSAAGELAPFGIRVNALAPAGINTAMLNQSGDDHVQALLSLQPLKRLAEPEEVAQTLLFLASDDSRHYTGQVFSPSGGAYLAS